MSQVSSYYRKSPDQLTLDLKFLGALTFAGWLNSL